MPAETLPIQPGDWSSLSEHLTLIRTGAAPILIPVTSRNGPSYGLGAVLSDGTTQGGTARIQHKMVASAHGLIFAYGNFYNNNGVETDGVNDITVAAALDDSTRTFPLTFSGGQRQAVIKPGCIALTDPLGVYYPKATTLYSRTFVSVTAAGKFPRGSDTLNAGASSNEGHNYPATATVGTDLTPLGSANTGLVGTHNGERVFGPMTILGVPTVRTIPLVAITGIGDSILAGSGDTGAFTDRGYFDRALNFNYPYLQLAFPSETLDGWMQQGGATRFRRANLLEQVTGITHIVCQLGINSISNVNWQTNMQQAHAFLASYGLPLYQTTITPKTTSTDSWATTANQTVTADEARRVAMNTYIRTRPSPLTNYIEVADSAETARDSGIWKAAYTSDGIHPNATGHAAIAATLTPSVFGPAAT